MTLLSVLLITAGLSLLFELAGKKESWEKEASSTFECGFTSYYFSRFSFSVHYYIVGLIFLFLDLELCFMMPFFLEHSISLTKVLILLFTILLLLGLLEEWKEGKLEWLN